MAKKRKVNVTHILLIIAGIIIIIPIIVLAIILLSARKESNTPINGSRFSSEQKYSISEKQVEELKEVISSVSNVDGAKVELKTATLRVYIDVNDSLEKDKYEDLFKQLFDKLDGILPISDYFTKTADSKEYDTEFHLYNDISKKDEEDFIYYTFTRTSTMAEKEYRVDLNTEAKNKELADELINGTPEDEAK